MAFRLSRLLFPTNIPPLLSLLALLGQILSAVHATFGSGYPTPVAGGSPCTCGGPFPTAGCVNPPPLLPQPQLCPPPPPPLPTLPPPPPLPPLPPLLPPPAPACCRPTINCGGVCGPPKGFLSGEVVSPIVPQVFVPGGAASESPASYAVSPSANLVRVVGQLPSGVQVVYRPATAPQALPTHSQTQTIGSTVFPSSSRIPIPVYQPGSFGSSSTSLGGAQQPRIVYVNRMPVMVLPSLVTRERYPWTTGERVVVMTSTDTGGGSVGQLIRTPPDPFLTSSMTTGAGGAIDAEGGAHQQGLSYLKAPPSISSSVNQPSQNVSSKPSGERDQHQGDTISSPFTETSTEHPAKGHSTTESTNSTSGSSDAANETTAHPSGISRSKNGAQASHDHPSLALVQDQLDHPPTYRKSLLYGCFNRGPYYTRISALPLVKRANHGRGGETNRASSAFGAQTHVATLGPLALPPLNNGCLDGNGNFCNSLDHPKKEEEEEDKDKGGWKQQSWTKGLPLSRPVWSSLERAKFTSPSPSEPSENRLCSNKTLQLIMAKYSHLPAAEAKLKIHRQAAKQFGDRIYHVFCASPTTNANRTITADRLDREGGSILKLDFVSRASVFCSVAVANGGVCYAFSTHPKERFS